MLKQNDADVDSELQEILSDENLGSLHPAVIESLFYLDKTKQFEKFLTSILEKLELDPCPELRQMIAKELADVKNKSMRACNCHEAAKNMRRGGHRGHRERSAAGKKPRRKPRILDILSHRDRLENRVWRRVVDGTSAALIQCLNQSYPQCSQGFNLSSAFNFDFGNLWAVCGVLVVRPLYDCHECVMHLHPYGIADRLRLAALDSTHVITNG